MIQQKSSSRFAQINGSDNSAVMAGIFETKMLYAVSIAGEALYEIVIRGISEQSNHSALVALKRSAIVESLLAKNWLPSRTVRMIPLDQPNNQLADQCSFQHPKEGLNL